NGINHTLHLILVINYNSTETAIPITLNPGNNQFKIPLSISGKIEISLYSPVTPAEVGLTLIPISNYGFLISSNQVMVNKGPANNLELIYIIGGGSIAVLLAILEIIKKRYL
ncbi:MAG: glycoside hydrolase, partial [Saccharolobus sp.]